MTERHHIREIHPNLQLPDDAQNTKTSKQKTATTDYVPRMPGLMSQDPPEVLWAAVPRPMGVFDKSISKQYKVISKT